MGIEGRFDEVEGRDGVAVIGEELESSIGSRIAKFRISTPFFKNFAIYEQERSGQSCNPGAR